MRRRQNVVEPEIRSDRRCATLLNYEYTPANHTGRGSLGPTVLSVCTAGCKLYRSARKGGSSSAHLPSAAIIKSTPRALTNNGPNGTFSRFSPPSISSNQVAFASTYVLFLMPLKGWTQAVLNSSSASEAIGNLRWASSQRPPPSFEWTRITSR